MKLSFKMWKASWVILIGYIVLLIFDLASTTTVGELLQYMESSPAYIYLGWGGLIGINILALYLLLKGYDTDKPTNRFMIITAFIYISVTRFFVSINNLAIGSRVQSGEITKAMVEGVSESTRIASHSWMILLNILAPLIFTLAIYFLFSLDHKIEIAGGNKMEKEEEKGKEKRRRGKIFGDPIIECE